MFYSVKPNATFKKITKRKTLRFTPKIKNVKMHSMFYKVQNGENIMANNEAKAALEQFKKEAANEVGVTLNNGYNGDLTARQAGSIGGQMVNIV